MKTAAITLALILGTGVGSSFGFDVVQINTSTQAIEQSISGAAAAVLNLNPAPVGSTLTLEQRGINAGNLVTAPNAGIATLDQITAGTQTIANQIEAAQSALNALTQSGMNIGAFVDAGTIGSLTQTVGPRASQQAENKATLQGGANAVDQAGTNIGALTLADEIVSTLPGEPHGIGQSVVNDASLLTAAAQVVGAISQSGVNFGTVIIAGKVVTVDRAFAGDQSILNAILVNGTAQPGLSQSALNIGNYVMASSATSVSQTATGSQSAVNALSDPYDEGLGNDDDGLDQSTTSFGNVFVLNGSGQQDVSVAQSSSMNQYSAGSGTHTQTGSISVISN